MTKTKFGFDGYDKNGFDKEGYNKNCFNRERIHKETGTKYNPEGFDIDGYNEEGYNQRGYDINSINKEGINQYTGQKDERIQFAEEFIATGKSIEQFAKDRNMKIEEVRIKIENIRNSPCISGRLDDAFRKNSNKFVGTVKTKKDQLLDGKISIKEVKNINIILRFCSEEESQKITELLIKSVATHAVSILEYRNIFGIEKISPSLPNDIIKNITKLSGTVKNSQNKDIRMLTREIYKESDRIKGYNAPYKPEIGEAMGYFEKPTDKQPKRVEITDEHREMAKQYLIANDEFICKKTMGSTLMKIVKGEIDDKILERSKKEKELRSLQRKDKELDEVINMAEKVIEEKECNNIAQNLDENDEPKL